MNIITAIALMLALVVGIAWGLSNPLPKTVKTKGVCHTGERVVKVKTGENNFITCATSYSERRVFLEKEK